MSRLKQLGKDSIVYGVGGVVSRSISFFLLPVYTRIFTPEDYGTIEMIIVLSSFLAVILTMGMDSAQSMYFFKTKKNGKTAQARLISAILQWKLTWGIGIVLFSTLCTPLLNAWFFGGKLGWEYFALAFVSCLLSQIMAQSVEVYRLLYRPWAYIGITLSQTVLAASMSLVFILVFDQGILGFLLGGAIASLLMGIVGWYRLREYLNFKHWHKDWWPILLKFGLPLIPAGLGMYVMNTADRIFIQHYHGASALGLYSVGAKFAMIMALVVEVFRKAWWPIAMDAMHSDDGPEVFRSISRLFMGGFVIAVLFLALLSPWLMGWVVAPVYYEAWPIIGILAWQSVFYGFYLVGSAGIWKAEKTYISMYLMGGAAFVNLFLNWCWVPTYGGMGAATATAISFFCLVFSAMLISERYWKVGFPYRILFFQIFLGGTVVVWLLMVQAQWWANVFLVIFCAGMLLISMLDRPQWTRLYQKITMRLRSSSSD